MPLHTNHRPKTTRATDNAPRIQATPRSPITCFPPLPSTVKMMSAQETPTPNATAVATAAVPAPSDGRPCDHGAAGGGEEDPGAGVEDHHEHAAHRRPSHRWRDRLGRVVTGQRPQLDRADRDQEAAADHLEDTQRRLARLDRRQAEGDRQQDRQHGAVGPEHHPQAAREPALGRLGQDQELDRAGAAPSAIPSRNAPHAWVGRGHDGVGRPVIVGER